MSRLVVDQIDFNEPETVLQVMDFIQSLANRPDHYLALRVNRGTYFELCGGTIYMNDGIYVILEGQVPLYVGESDFLYYRLGSTDGSLDNFRNAKRTCDPRRNFIKRFVENRFYGDLNVWFMGCEEIVTVMNLRSPLSRLDRQNLEKFVDINRGRIQFLKEPFAARTAATASVH